MPIFCPLEHRRQRPRMDAGMQKGRVSAGVQGRRSGCEPPLDIADTRCRPSFSFRTLAMDRHRPRAADGLRVAKGPMPFAADGPLYPQSSRTCPTCGWTPSRFGRNDGSRDTVESSQGRGPQPGKWGGTDARLYRIERIESPYSLTALQPYRFTRLIVFCYTARPNFWHSSPPPALLP